MKNFQIFYVMVTLMMLCPGVSYSQSQDGLAEELDREIEALYPEETVQPKRSARVVREKAVQSRDMTVTLRPNPRIQRVEQEVIEQPPTVVIDTPLSESRADRLRKSRMKLEEETEEKIVERLESDRMDSERIRADKVMSRLDGGDNTEGRHDEIRAENTIAAPVVVTQPVQVVVPAQEVVTTSEDVGVVQELEDVKFFLGAVGGVGDYPGIKNIESGMAAGIIGGAEFSESLVVEGGFLYSSYEMEVINQVQNDYYNPYATLPIGSAIIKNVDQYNVSAAVKYRFSTYRLRPLVGLLTGYTRRTYSDRQYFAVTSEDVTSQALDVGALTGLDVLLGQSFVLGFEFRYMTNLTYNSDSEIRNSYFYQPRIGTPLEELDYYTFTVNGKIRF